MGEFADDHLDSMMNDMLDDNDDFSFRRPKRQTYRYITIKGELVRETDGAYLWQPEDDDEGWIPKSQTSSIRPDNITITTWIAEKKGWL